MEVWWDDTASAASGERSMVTSTLARSRPVGEIWPMFSTVVDEGEQN